MKQKGKGESFIVGARSEERAVRIKKMPGRNVMRLVVALLLCVALLPAGVFADAQGPQGMSGAPAAKTAPAPVTKTTFTWSGVTLKSKTPVQVKNTLPAAAGPTRDWVTGQARSMKLNWKRARNVSAIDGYIIFRRNGNNKTYEEIAKVGKNTTQYIDTKANRANVAYTYTIVGYKKAGNSIRISPCAHWASGVTTRSARKNGYWMIPNTAKCKVQTGSQTTLTLRHTHPSQIHWSNSVRWYSDNPKVATVQKNGRVTGKSPGTTTIRGRLASGRDMLFQVTVITRQTPKAPTLKRQYVTPRKIALSWNKVAYATHYDVYVSTDRGGSYQKIATTKGTQYTHRNLSAGKEYRYRVIPRNVGGSTTKVGKASNTLTQKAAAAGMNKSTLLGLINQAPSGTSLRTFHTTYSLTQTAKGRELRNYLPTLCRSYKVSIFMIDLNTGQGLCYAPDRSIYSASCLKGPYVAAINKYSPSAASKYKGWEQATITVSNNETYRALHQKFGTSPMKRMVSAAGVTSYNGTRRYAYIKPRDLSKLWLETYWYFYKDTNSNSAFCRGLYTHGTQSFIYQGLKNRYTVHTKPGWYPGGGFNVQNDAGVVMAKVDGASEPYLLVVMTSACGQHAKLQRLVQLIDDVHTEMMR